MGTNAALLGPYPPSALTLGLQSAVVEYSGKLSGEHVTPQPAHLVVRDVDAHKLSCLVFGRPARPAPPCGGNQVGTGVRPEVIAIGCATSAEYLKDITWEKWTGTGLDGLAELYTRSANGAVSAAQVKIGLSNSGYVRGKLVFRTLSFTTATGPPQTLTVPGASWGWVTSGR